MSLLPIRLELTRQARRQVLLGGREMIHEVDWCVEGLVRLNTWRSRRSGHTTTTIRVRNVVMSDDGLHLGEGVSQIESLHGIKARGALFDLVHCRLVPCEIILIIRVIVGAHGRCTRRPIDRRHVSILDR